MRQFQYSFLVFFMLFTGCAGMQTSGDKLVDAEVAYQETVKKLTVMGNAGQLSQGQIGELNKAIRTASTALKLAKSADSEVAKDNNLLFLQTVLILQSILAEVDK